ncbi:frizzled-4 [Parasteatoda tepidariorum]|uniref:frizzled-4 n=1 Tax=Parasteatoda tepidariorum TaxID=114398 RepID=UPI00077FCD5F|nr:frizzled-4 [Parasteatoda tepidariorum]
MIYILLLLLGVSAYSEASERTCEPIRIEICRDIGYNVTGMPNLVGHELQQDAQLQLQTFQPLIQYGCSSRLQFFLCSVYVPMCTEKVPDPIGPCRSLCEDIRDKCQPVLQEFGFPWPSGLNCSKFPPQNNNKHMCMEGPADSSSDPNMRMRSRNRRPNVIRNDVTFSDRKMLPFNKMFSQHYGLCKNYRFSDQYYYINRTQKCAHLCSANIKFTQENKLFADYWVAAWSILCFVCTLFSLFIVFMGEYKLSRFPEAVIVFICICFNFCSAAYIIRFFVGRYYSSCHMDHQHGVAILAQEGLDNASCMIIFIVLYCFKLATDTWWVILCITWYLTNCLKWKAESILKYRNLIHTFGWGIPSCLTIVAMITRVSDADELVGICYVGNQNTQNLLFYVLIPNGLHWVIGIFFLFLAALPKKCRNEVYTHVQVNPNALPNTRNEDDMLSYVGIFAYLYTIPALCVISADLYEYKNRDEWVSANSQAAPIVEIFSLKVFMLLIMGAAASFVIFTSSARKRAFKTLCRRFTRRKEPVPSYLRVNPQVLQMSVRTKSSLSKTNSETIM